jgi:SpoVK/Ycf46/Vps4 family AAA+-type ATPase
VVFIDEIDSLVPARGSGQGEPQVTGRVVNTILAEMDGLEELQSVVVIGATNRPALVDPAMLRPGRFDELVYVGTPDKPGREHILGIHTAKMPLAKGVDLAALAAKTDRFTGADLEDLVRRAGLAALRRVGGDVTEVGAQDFETQHHDCRAGDDGADSRCGDDGDRSDVRNDRQHCGRHHGVQDCERERDRRHDGACCDKQRQPVGVAPSLHRRKDDHGRPA